jgi:hypothetical protein
LIEQAFIEILLCDRHWVYNLNKTAKDLFP